MKLNLNVVLYVLVACLIIVEAGKKNKDQKKEQSIEKFREAHSNERHHKSRDRVLNWKVKTNYFKKPERVKKSRTEESTDRSDFSNFEDVNPNKKQAKSSKSKRPNIILFLTDDQDVELGSLSFMPKLEKLLRNNGAFFPNAYVSTPMCCPSRSSLLTGLYVHNHRVLTNSDNCSSTYWQTEHEPRTFGAYLATAGYRTGYFGKYLNKYNGSYVPPGWRHWEGLVMNSKYYNYTINKNGHKVRHGFDYSKDYYPDLVTNDSLKFIQEWKEEYSSSPMMLVMSYPSPHGPEDAAPQFSDMYFNVTTHRTPSYDFAPNPDKQWVLRWVNKMEPVHHRFTDHLMTRRLQTLQSVDDAVERVYKELKAIGELDNTYIFYTSDHGYHLGQFGLVKGKSFPFEFDVRVPFIVKGPGIKPGMTVMNIVGNVDLAPTFLDIAGIPQPSHMDGTSFLRFLTKKSSGAQPQEQKRWRDTILLERGRPPPSQLAPLNTIEDIPLPNPPTPPTTTTPTPPERIHKDSEGAEGDDGDDIAREYPKRPPKFEMLAIECQKAQYQSPCEMYQKWECIQVGDHWKMRRCPLPAIYGIPGSCHCVKKKKISRKKILKKERKMQREFLKEHVNRDINEYRPRFLKMNKRTRRGLFDEDPFFLALEQEDPENPISDIVAEGELEEVELLMEGLNEEISSLQGFEEDNSTTLKPTTPRSPVFASCQMSHGKNVTCNSQVYEDVKHWWESKESIEIQIRLLKTQLEEMKMIRRHLTSIRPAIPRLKPSPPLPPVNDSSPEEVFEEYIIDPMGPVDTPSIGNDQDSDDEDIDSDGDDLVGNENDTFSYKLDDDKSTSGGETVWNVGFVDLETGPTQGSVDGVERYEPDGNQNLTSGKDDETCICDKRLLKKWRKKQEEIRRLEQKRRLKEQREKKKQRKLRRKQAREQAGCNLEKMNCFNHDNEHWRTEPLWTDGQFCVCMNANNNTYWCLRTINATHNFLYCEFITGFVTFYDMRIDQYQLRNIAHTLTEDELNFLHSVLVKYRSCKGEECIINLGAAWRKEDLKKTQSLKKVKSSPLRISTKHNDHNNTELRRKKQSKHWRQQKRGSRELENLALDTT